MNAILGCENCGAKNKVVIAKDREIANCNCGRCKYPLFLPEIKPATIDNLGARLQRADYNQRFGRLQSWRSRK